MRGTAMTLIMMCAATVLGCVSAGTHERTLAELEEARKTSAKTAAALDSFMKQSAIEADALKKQRETLDQELIGVKQALDQSNTRIVALEEERQRLVSGTIPALTQERDQLLTSVERQEARLKTEEAEKARLEQERAAKEAEVQRLTQTHEDLTKSQEQVTAALTEARAQAQEETSRLQATLEQEKARLKAEEAEKARLEQERAAKEAEIQRLTQTHADLTKSLQAEIAKGDIRIKQVRDRLTINMVDRVLFDSGQGQVKPAGLKILKQVSDILKNVTDKQIRIEGHTDNVPIGAKLKGKFTTNWELSTARATSVVRYLIDEGGVDRANLSAVGYADMRPVASNDTEEGRAANRRIEITLYPKDLSEIANQIKP